MAERHSPKLVRMAFIALPLYEALHLTVAENHKMEDAFDLVVIIVLSA